MKKKILDIKENADELNAIMHQTKDAYKKIRLNMLILLKNQHFQTRKAIANHLGFHRNAIGRWLAKYQRYGTETMLKKQSPGCPKGQRTLSKEVFESLREKLKEPKGFSSYIEIQSWIEKEHGLQVSYSTLYKIIRKEFQAKPKVPRKSHKEKDESKYVAFQEGLGDKLKLLANSSVTVSDGIPTETLTEAITESSESLTEAITEVSDVADSSVKDSVEPIRVFAEDESRLGLMPIIRRRITLKGIKPIKRVHHRFENYYIYGAVEPTTGDNYFLELPYLNSDCFQIFLDQFSMSYSDSFIIMVLDNGAFHKAKKLLIPDNMVLLFTPPYSPELNPIERLWQALKDELSSFLFETLDELKESVAGILKRYSFQDIASLTGYSYFVDAVNAL